MRILSPLRNAPTALLWAGLSLSAIGDQLYSVGVGWISVGLLGSRAGYLTSLQFLVLLLAALGIGRWADGWEQRRSMIGADLVRAGILLAVIAAWLTAGTPSLIGLIATIIVLALCQAVFQPALQTVLPGVVANTALLPAANGLLDATDRSARLIGPGLVAALAGIVPTVHFLTIDAISFLVSAAALLWIGRLRPGLTSPLVARSGALGRESAWRGMKRGIRALRAHPLLGYYLKATGLVNGAWNVLFFVALPLAIAQRGIHGPGGAGLGAYGLVISAYGLTNLASTLVFGSRLMPDRPQFQMFGGGILTGFGMMLMGPALLLPTSGVLPALMASAALSAIGGPMKDIPMAVLRQTRVAPADMGAAMRAYIAATSAGTLAALLLVPSLIAAFGMLPVIIGCGGVVVAVGGLALGLFSNWSESVLA